MTFNSNGTEKRNNSREENRGNSLHKTTSIKPQYIVIEQPVVIVDEHILTATKRATEFIPRKADSDKDKNDFGII